MPCSSALLCVTYALLHLRKCLRLYQKYELVSDVPNRFILHRKLQANQGRFVALRKATCVVCMMNCIPEGAIYLKLHFIRH